MRYYLNNLGIAFVWFAIAMVAAFVPSEGQCASSGKGKVVQLADKGSDIDVCRAIPVPVVVVEGSLPGRLAPGKRVILKARGSGKTTAEVIAIYKDEKEAGASFADAVKDKEAVVLWKAEKGKEIVLLVPSKEFGPEPGTKVKLKMKRARKVEGC